MSRVGDADRTPIPLSAAGVARYLSDHQITIVVEGGRPKLRKPPVMNAEWFAAHVSRVRPSLSKHRDEILADLQVYADGPRVSTRPPKPAEIRLAVFARLAAWAAGSREYLSGRVAGFCGYDRSTRYLDAGAAAFPPHWTAAAVTTPDGGRALTCWEELPGSRPPPGWKAPKDWLPTEVMQPPPGWQAPVVNRQKLARKAWAARWKTEATFPDTQPPD